MKRIIESIFIVLLVAGMAWAAAGVGISAWTKYTEAINGSDYLAMTDVSDTTGSDDGTSKAATVDQFIDYLINVGLASYWARITDLENLMAASSYTLNSLSDLLIIDSTEPQEGRQLMMDSINYGDADDHLHNWSIEKTGSQLAGKENNHIYLHKSANYTLTGDECLSEVTVFVDAAATITSCAYASTAKPLTVVATGNFPVSAKMNAADRMLLAGVGTLDNGDKATSQSTSGDTIYCEPESTDGYFCWSGTPAGLLWTDGGQ